MSVSAKFTPMSSLGFFFLICPGLIFFHYPTPGLSGFEGITPIIVVVGSSSDLCLTFFSLNRGEGGGAHNGAKPIFEELYL